MSKSEKDRPTKTIVNSPKIYPPLGPYNQAILVHNKTLYISGILGMDAQAQIVCGGAEAQARQALENLKYVLEAGGSSMQSVVKTTLMLSNMNDFQTINKVYEEYFTKDYPARSTFQVARLPRDAAFEMEVIALTGDAVVAHAGPCPCAR